MVEEIHGMSGNRTIRIGIRQGLIRCDEAFAIQGCA